MKRTQALLIAVALGIAVVVGAFSAFRTTQLGAKATTPRVSAATIARQNRALDRFEASLRKQLAQKPPAVKPLPAAPAARPAAAPAPAQAVIYHRPPPVVHVIHRHGGEGEDGGHDGGDGGGGLDD